MTKHQEVSTSVSRQQLRWAVSFVIDEACEDSLSGYALTGLSRIVRFVSRTKLTRLDFNREHRMKIFVLALSAMDTGAYSRDESVTLKRSVVKLVSLLYEGEASKLARDVTAWRSYAGCVVKPSVELSGELPRLSRWLKQTPLSGAVEAALVMMEVNGGTESSGG